MDSLTKKEALAVEYFLAGDSQTEAVMKSYQCKSRDSARSIGARVFNRPRVSAELAIRQQTLQQRLVDNNLKFIELVEKYAPRNAVAQQLAANMLCEDKRVSSAAIDQYLKIRGEYAPTRAIEAKFNMENKGEEGIIHIFRSGELLEKEGQEIRIRPQDIAVVIDDEEEKEVLQEEAKEGEERAVGG